MGIDNMKPGRDALKESRISVRNFRITRVFLEEIFELQTNTDDLGGEDTNFTICNTSTGNLNAVGRDFLAYVYVKDSKAPGSGSSSKFSFSFH